MQHLALSPLLALLAAGVSGAVLPAAAVLVATVPGATVPGVVAPVGLHHVVQNRVLAEVPFELSDGYLFFSLRVGESDDLTYLFDTGCTTTSIDSTRARLLGLEATEIVRESGAGPTVERMVDGAGLSLGGWALGEVNLLLGSTDPLEERLGVDFHGVIGADLLRDHVIRLDYDRMIITVFESDGFVHSGEGRAVDIDANPYFSTMEAHLDVGNGEVLSGRFLIDTGAGVALALNTPFVNDHDLVEKVGSRDQTRTLVAKDVTMSSHPGRISGFRVGGFEFADMPVLLAQTQVGPLSRAISGIIGNHIWKRFNTTFDYRRDKLYLEPNRFFAEEFRVR